MPIRERGGSGVASDSADGFMRILLPISGVAELQSAVTCYLINSTTIVSIITTTTLIR